MNVLIQIMIASLVIDRFFGEPPMRFHPTAWVGRLIASLEERLGDSITHGALIFLAVTIPAAFIAFVIMDLVGVEGVGGVLLASLFLKLQFAWRSTREHADSVVRGLSQDLEAARRAVSRMVGRKTGDLDGEHVISATVESVGESSVDGIIAPLFYYLVFGAIFGAAHGIGAAVFYRAVNTLDSMIGYKKEGYNRLGFVSAKADDMLNYIPARITSILMVVSSGVLREDTIGAIRVLWRDRRKTASPNSGHSMSALAGALGIQLEKIGFHRLGDSGEKLTPGHISRAVRLVDFTVLSFLVISLVMFIA
ncbi:MAG: cobalamin biosynthesis protein [Candidatus Hydrothermarchaeaceae archaeon]